MIDRDELAAWLRLVGTPGVGREAARRLLGEFGSPQRALDARPRHAGRWSVTPGGVALATEPPEFAALLAAPSPGFEADRSTRREAVATCWCSATRAIRQRCSKPRTRRRSSMSKAGSSCSAPTRSPSSAAATPRRRGWRTPGPSPAT
jgi:hypothetical protein